MRQKLFAVTKKHQHTLTEKRQQIKGEKRRHLLTTTTTTTETTHTHFNILFKLRQNTLACFKNIFMCLRPKKTIRIHLSSLILAWGHLCMVHLCLFVTSFLTNPNMIKNLIFLKKKKAFLYFFFVWSSSLCSSEKRQTTNFSSQKRR